MKPLPAYFLSFPALAAFGVTQPAKKPRQASLAKNQLLVIRRSYALCPVWCLFAVLLVVR